MKITNATSSLRSLKLREPYTVAYESFDMCEVVFTELTTDQGTTGRGCAAPDLHVTGESAAAVLQSMNRISETCLRGRDVFEYGQVMEELKQQLPDEPATRSMVDMALHDLIAQKAGVPLYKLLGGYRKSIPTSITIGIQTLESTLSMALRYTKQGFRILKVKGGLDVREDIEKINRIREVVGKKISIRFDANQGYTLQDSLNFIKGVRKADIELLEQPVKKNDIDFLRTLTHTTDMPVMADESLQSLNDAFLLSKDRSTDLINIKLMKTGGILEAMHINSVARAAGIGVMVGCMDESALGIAAGLHFALSRPNILYADLDGHLDLLEDPFQGMLSIVEGNLIPPETRGLGWLGLKNINI
jgi:L-alanine-DL-glutamate epimerase-like enolase superfamily enzyme